MKRLAFLLFALLLSFTALAEKRAFTIEDFYRVKSLSELSLSRDGRSLVFTVTSPDLPHAKRSQRIWITEAAGGTPRELTRGDADTGAQFSPDGRSVVFLRDNNLWLLPLGGGEARQLTTISTGVTDPVWSDDGKWIAFATDVYPECGGDDACNKRIADRWSGGKLKAHMADSLLYRHWTAWKEGTVTHTWIVNVESGETRDLTPGRFDWPMFQLGGASQYDFSPDGRELAVVSNHDAQPASSTNGDIWLINLADRNAQPRNITASNRAFDGTPRYSPDGRWIAYRMQKDPGYESSLVQLALYDRTAGTSRVITPTFDNWVEDFGWSDDSRSIYFSGPVEGHNPIFRLDLASGAVTKLIDDRTIDDFEIAAGNAVYY